MVVLVLELEDDDIDAVSLAMLLHIEVVVDEVDALITEL